VAGYNKIKMPCQIGKPYNPRCREDVISRRVWLDNVAPQSFPRRSMPYTLAEIDAMLFRGTQASPSPPVIKLFRGVSTPLTPVIKPAPSLKSAPINKIVPLKLSEQGARGRLASPYSLRTTQTLSLAPAAALARIFCCTTAVASAGSRPGINEGMEATMSRARLLSPRISQINCPSS